ncbi:Na+/H+ antiporter NhaA [Nocardiopsis composta]|uniref:Na(+)/H(+) antiporter NhaA n=1 Tax=Nocardiopsis composta TaxID=157465 RepID=A0A7W8QSP3_9ACTN|nr:Na+/H+ antiporter NhaA [Nocardiopsis composta]MBB5435875.1 Na+/H+ antiporter NhaA [Nocardiopsis composta]
MNTTSDRHQASPPTAFLRSRGAATLLLLLAAIAGLAWANSPWGDGYEHFWETPVGLDIGGTASSLTLHQWVNDGLMVLFFLAIGLELSRELTLGELRERRVVVVPVCAAVGGVVGPALIYLAFNAGGPGAMGWGIPVGTDTAFALGLISVIGARCPAPLRVFLLTLSIADDILAIAVIALFYTTDLSLPALGASVVLLALIAALRKLRVGRIPAYVVLGIALWAAVFQSGVHPTLAGIVVGVLVTVYPPEETRLLRASETLHAFTLDPGAQRAREAARSLAGAVPPNVRLQLQLDPWVTYLIVPLFALANTGIRVDGPALAEAATSPVTLGIVFGLVVGKTVGVCAGTWIPLRMRWGTLPGGLVWGQVAGGAAICGVGFTMALFITGLAFDDPVLRNDAVIGVIAGSLLSAGLGWLIFKVAWNRGGECAAPDEGAAGDGPPPRLADPVGDTDHVRGPDDAPVTIVEYGDYECPYCGEAHPSVEALLERYPDEVRFAFRHFPLRRIHPNAGPAAIAAEAAAAHGVFWEMHGTLFTNQLALGDRDLVAHAGRLGFYPWQDVPRHEARVARDEASARASGVRGTPAFFINGERYTGRLDTASLSAAVDAALALAAPDRGPLTRPAVSRTGEEHPREGTAAEEDGPEGTDRPRGGG